MSWVPSHAVAPEDRIGLRTHSEHMHARASPRFIQRTATCAVVNVGDTPIIRGTGLGFRHHSHHTTGLLDLIRVARLGFAGRRSNDPLDSHQNVDPAPNDD